jgi:hypothetical protein
MRCNCIAAAAVDRQMALYKVYDLDGPTGMLIIPDGMRQRVHTSGEQITTKPYAWQINVARPRVAYNGVAELTISSVNM